MGTGPGTTALYQHYQDTDKEPDSGWQATRQSDSSPAFVYLRKKLRDRSIQLDTNPHIVYNDHPSLYIIHPFKFPKFFADVKDIFLQEAEPEQESKEESNSVSKRESFNISNISLNSFTHSSPPASPSSPPLPCTTSQASLNMSSHEYDDALHKIQ